MTTDTVKELERAALAAALVEMGRPARGTVALLAGLLAVLAAVTVAAAGGALAWGIAIPVLVLVHYAAYTPLHEAVHRNLSGGVKALGRLDDFAGVVCGTLLGVPFTIHRAEHFAHHRATNRDGEDPDKVFGPGVAGVLLGLLRMVPAQYRWYARTVLPGASTVVRRRVALELALIVAVRLVPALAGHAEAVLWLSIVPMLLGNALTGFLFAWIVHEPGEDSSRWGCTAVFHADGAARWALTVGWLWQNYHAVHHLFPRVPFYRYHRVFERIETTMERLGTPVHRLGGSAVRAPAATPPA